MLWAYTDCMAKNGPKLTMDDGTIIGCDPATGRNQEVNFTWEQLCIATTYELAIAKDKAYRHLEIFGGHIHTGIVTSPALIYLSGGEGTCPELMVIQRLLDQHCHTMSSMLPSRHWNAAIPTTGRSESAMKLPMTWYAARGLMSADSPSKLDSA